MTRAVHHGNSTAFYGQLGKPTAWSSWALRMAYGNVKRLMVLARYRVWYMGAPINGGTPNGWFMCHKKWFQQISGLIVQPWVKTVKTWMGCNTRTLMLSLFLNILWHYGYHISPCNVEVVSSRYTYQIWDNTAYAPLSHMSTIWLIGFPKIWASS